MTTTTEARDAVSTGLKPCPVCKQIDCSWDGIPANCSLWVKNPTESPDLVERVARALQAHDDRHGMGQFPDGTVMRSAEWNEHSEDQHEEWRGAARAAIAAIPSQAGELERLRVELTNQSQDAERWQKRCDALAAQLTAKDQEIARYRDANKRLCDGYADAVSGYRYIIQAHGRMSGVGFDRVLDHYFKWVEMPEREGLTVGSHELAALKGPSDVG